ncbi:MAG: DNA mismatch repair protein MutS, partial [Desulfuromusa sp.]|nr:DNA mismatch repair protein MutS [Desulfuromusa sp.]
HYHELTDLPLTRARIKNYNVAVKEWNDQIIFLRKIISGSASRSYGIQVGRLAGLPDSVIDRAKEILHNLEAGEFVRTGEPRLGESKNQTRKQPLAQLSLFPVQQGDEIRTRLESVDIRCTTPVEALTILDQLQKML